MKWLLLALLTGSLVNASSYAVVQNLPCSPSSRSCRFTQFYSTRFTFPSSPLTPAWPALPFDSVQQALTLQGIGNEVAVVISSASLLLWASDWRNVNSFGASLNVTSGCRVCEGRHGGDAGVFVACPHGLPPHGDIQAIATYAQSIGALGPGNYTATCLTQASQPITEPLQALVLLGDSIMAAGNVTIHYRSGEGIWRKEWIGGPIDGAVQSISLQCATSDATFSIVAVGTNQSLSRISSDQPLLFSRIGSLEGLPFSSVTALSLSPTAAAWPKAWVGTSAGLAVGDFMAPVTTGTPVPHSFLAGPRWLPVKDESPILSAVYHIASFSGSGWSKGLVGQGGGAWIATAGGLAMIEEVQMSLEDKANQLQKISDSRHDRYGLSSYCDMPVWGDVTQCITGDDDNDGLWTCVYAAGLAFKYAVTQIDDDRQRAWHRFEAIEFLHLVTGIPGLVARSVLNQSIVPPTATWYQSKVFPGWVWKGDTSSDEIAGHMFALPIIYDLVAKTTAEKQRVRDLVCLQLHYIISNGYTLVDADGNVTTWGKWDPVTLNMNRYFYDGRGLNSLQILSWIASGLRMCPDMEAELQAAHDYLVEQHSYDDNVLNAKITDPTDRNDSDDELTFLPFYTWAWAINFTALPPYVMQSLQRTYAFISIDRSSLYAIIARASGVKDVRDDDCTWDLEQSSTQLILWGASNSQRQDLFSRYPVADERRQALLPIPYGERPTNYRWNSDPLDLDGSYGGSEMDAGYFVLPYWMARFHGFIEK